MEDPTVSAFGTFSFDSTFTRSSPFVNSTANTSGTSIASVLLGLPASGQLGYTSPVSLQNHYAAAFIQDDWKIAKNLTINIGLRWELETPYTERYNRQSYGFDPNVKSPITVPGLNLRGSVLFTGVNGNSRLGGQIDSNNFGPRFGFAYRLNERTVVRGGYGMFFSPVSENGNFYGQIGTFDGRTTYVGTTDGEPPPPPACGILSPMA